MLQICFATLFLPLGIIFILLSLVAFGWLVIHVEHSRHFSKTKALLAGIIGSFFMGLGLQFVLLWFGA